MSIIVKELTRLRKLHKISQQTIADRIGMDVTTISRIENGHTDPGISTIEAIIRAIGHKTIIIPDTNEST